MRCAIINTRLITLQGEGLGIIDDGAVSFSDGKIDFVGNTYDLDRSSVENVIDGSGHVTMPGLVNTHTHTGSTILRGAAQDVPELEWMNKAIRPFSKHLKEEDKILGSKLGVIEGLRSGITTFGEYTSNVGRLIDEVYSPFNVRVSAAETINEVVSKRYSMGPNEKYVLDGNKGKKSLNETDKLYKKYQGSKSIAILYGPQALDMVSPDTLERVKEHADKRKAKIHMHVAQGERERLQIKERYGNEATTVNVLNKMNLLDSSFIAAHCHDTSDREKEIMVEKGADMIGCPSSIAMIDGIVPPVSEFISLGGTVGLGTDQAPGPGTHNMFREMRTVSIMTKTKFSDPTILPAWDTLRLGCVGGAEVLGLGEKIGTLKKGKSADIMTIDISKANLTPSVEHPFHNYIPNLVYSSSGSEVDNVFIEGKSIIKGGDFVDIDEKSIIKEAQKRASSIFQEAADDWEQAECHLVDVAREGLI